jgi:protease YdgD
MTETNVLKRYAIPLLLSIVLVAIPGLAASEVVLDQSATELHREIVDVNAYPWSSIGKVNVAGFDNRQSCTGSVIGSKQFLTAAHCLYNARTTAHQLISAGSIHFVLGFNMGEYSAHRVGARYTVSPKFDYNNKETAGDDWAVVDVEEPFPPDIRPLRLATTRSLPGTSVKTGGYSTYQSEVMTADKHCHITAVSADWKLIFNDCVLRHGDSGAPLLGEDGDTEGLIWGVVSLGLGVAESQKQSKATGVAAAAAPIADFIASQPM